MLIDTDPEQVAEARAFLEVLRPMMERTAAGTGETVRFTLTVPVEDAMLAAWLVMKNSMREARKQRPLGRAVCLKRESDGYRLADWWRAKLYLKTALKDRLALEWAYLDGGNHPLLYPVQPLPKPDPSCDDDIPF